MEVSALEARSDDRLHGCLRQINVVLRKQSAREIREPAGCAAYGYGPTTGPLVHGTIPDGRQTLRPRSWSWPDDRSRLQVVELHVLDSQFVLPDAKQVIQADLVRTKAGRQRHRPFVLPPSLCGPSSSRLGAPRSCARSEPGDLPHHARTSRMRWLFATTISSRRTTASNVSMNGTSTVAMVSLPTSPRATLITDFVPGQLPALPIVRPSKSTNSPAGPKALSSPVPAFATTIRPSASRVVPTTR